MVLVRGLGGHPKAEERHDIGREVREAVRRIGDQHARAAQQPDGSLHDDEDGIDDRREQRHAIQGPQAIPSLTRTLAGLGRDGLRRSADSDPHFRSNAREIAGRSPAAAAGCGGGNPSTSLSAPGL
jgi:hypothetical protein